MYYNYGTPYHMPTTMNPQLPEAPSCAGGQIYTVRPGDTMFRIANQFGISLQVLIQANPQVTNPNVLFVGQRICVPGVPVPPPPPSPFCPDGTIYTVQRGDSMFTIARKYGITLEQLIAANPQVADPNVIDVGQKICIPRKVTPPPPPVPLCPDGTIYTVQRGDSLFTIAQKFGVTLQRLIAANPQIADPNVIDIGQQICVPVPDAPLPAGICKVALKPEKAGILGGCAFINIADPTLWITTFGLPPTSELGEGLCTYRAWVVDKETSTYFRVEIKPTGLPGIDAGYGKTTGSFKNYDEIIVTAEKTPVPSKPCGPVVLRGSLRGCR